MAEQMSKSVLLGEMSSGYAEFETALAPLSAEQMVVAGANGDWSVKDIVAHIVTWQHKLLERLQAAARNETPVLYFDLSEEEVDRLNEQFYQESKARPLVEVLNDFRATHSQIVEVVRTFKEEDLTNARRFDWMKGNALWQLVAGDTYEHYRDHIASIRSWAATNPVS